MAENRAAAGPEQQGAEGVAGLGRGQDGGQAGREEESLRSGGRASPGDRQSQEEEKQDGEEG